MEQNISGSWKGNDVKLHEQKTVDERMMFSDEELHGCFFSSHCRARPLELHFARVPNEAAGGIALVSKHA
jgi:hypothetical protein